jgi:hypothetical protein
MTKKILHAIGLALFHGSILIAAHHIATHVGFEIAGLVRDELFINATEALSFLR